jgi:hypothetical protein
MFPDLVTCTPQETAPGRTGKGQIEARLITNADNNASDVRKGCDSRDVTAGM